MPETIELVHDREYVRGFLGGTLADGIMRRIGFPWSEGLVLRTLASVGSTMAAAHDALWSTAGAEDWPEVRIMRSGTEGSGFCVFNDIAVAIEALRSERPDSARGDVSTWMCIRATEQRRSSSATVMC